MLSWVDVVDKVIDHIFDKLESHQIIVLFDHILVLLGFIVALIGLLVTRNIAFKRGNTEFKMGKQDNLKSSNFDKNLMQFSRVAI